MMSRIILTFFFVLSALFSLGQTYYNYAVTDKYRRLGRYHVEKNLVETIADTISLQEAKSIIAINAVRESNVQSEQNNVQVHDFTLQIEDGKKNKELKSVSDQLTSDMRKELLCIPSGTTLTFKKITIITYDETSEVPKQK